MFSYTLLHPWNNVRHHALYLLSRDANKEPFPRVTSEWEVAMYNLAKTGGPTAENFRLDFHSLIAWNKCATEVFATNFIECGWYRFAKKADV